MIANQATRAAAKTMTDPLDAMWARWNHVQSSLFPWMREEVEPMTELLGRLITILDVIGLEAFVPEAPRGAGRPPEERRAQVPSEATFSRAFTEFAQGDLPDRMHAALINRALGGRIIGAIARDATEIEAREKPVEKDKKDGPPPPSASVPPQNKHGRPRKGQERSSERPKPEPTRLERQTTQTASQMLADLPTACDVGTKKNSKGFKETWVGYKLHIDVACGQIPVSCVLTSASVHDSQVAIP